MREGSKNTSFVKIFKKVVAFGVTRGAYPRAWPGGGPPEGGQIVGKRRRFVGNEEIAFPDEQQRNAREQIAFPDEQKRNAREEIAFADCGRGVTEVVLLPPARMHVESGGEVSGVLSTC